MSTRLLRATVVAAALASAAAAPIAAASAHPASHARQVTRQRSHTPGHARAGIVPLAVQAPDTPQPTGDTAAPYCVTPGSPFTSTSNPTGDHVYPFYHCYTPADIRSAYSVDGVAPLSTGANQGQGQTIVLVDAYGSPTAQNDLDYFAQTFFPNGPTPNFTQVYPQGKPDYNSIAHGNGLSGPNGAANWSGEATLDIEWAYSIAPQAHIVLLAVPPAETEGVQGLPNLFKAIRWAIDTYPAGTVFSQSFGITEQTLEGAGKAQTAKFDAVYQDGLAKGDTFFASSGDNGATGASKQHKETTTYSTATTGYPATSPYVTAVGGTQLQDGWSWDPSSNVPFNADGSGNPDYFNSTSGGDSQVVWNESWLPAASGGGQSVIYPMPSWQRQNSTVADRIGTDARAVPDVAWNAAVDGGVLVYITAYQNYQRPGWHVYGGTSAASPQMAGVTALVNASRTDAGEPPIGFLNPLLYDGTTVPTSDFWDVSPTTEGTATGPNPGSAGDLTSNTLWQYDADGSVSPGTVAGWPTLTGWDMTTGFGSPIVSQFVADLTAH